MINDADRKLSICFEMYLFFRVSQKKAEKPFNVWCIMNRKGNLRLVFDYSYCER